MHAAIAFSETQLQSLPDDRSRTEWIHLTSSTYRNFSQLKLRQGDVWGALEIWEQYRGAALRGKKTTKPDVGIGLASELPKLTKETVVSYALLPKGLAVWVYDNRGIFSHWTEEDPGDIEAKANHFRSLCSDPNSDTTELKKNSIALYGLLAAPIEQRLPLDRTLVIELDEKLAGLPFDALLDTQNRYVGDRNSIVSSVGIPYKHDERAYTPITAAASALVASVPVSNGPTGPSLMPLPDALSEGEMVAHGFVVADLLVGKEATVEAVLSQLPGAAVFHFAGHAISSTQQSGLLLSDALLSASSLAKTSMSHMQLAVLSGCDTQDGSAGGVTGADSLVRVFLRAGVPHVIASRWNVDSVATRQFMDLFYRALLAGSTVAESIHQAQSILRSRPGMAHPYYWSAFTAFGAV